MLKSAFWTQVRLDVLWKNHAFKQTSKVPALARLPVQLELGLISRVFASSKYSSCDGSAGHGCHCPLPEPCQGLAGKSARKGPPQPLCPGAAALILLLPRKLLKRAETGQELSRHMQVQTQAHKVVFQVSGCYFP